MKLKIIIAGICVSMAVMSVHAAVVDDLLQEYQAQGAKNINAQAGQTMWTHSYGVSSEGKDRRCSTCHGEDLRKSGKHMKTGKLIEPLAPSVNRKRLTDVAEIEKWFKRNCEWTLGRECNVQEKSDFLAYIKAQ